MSEDQPATFPHPSLGGAAPEAPLDASGVGRSARPAGRSLHSVDIDHSATTSGLGSAESNVSSRFDQDNEEGLLEQFRGRLVGERMGPKSKTLAMLRSLEREVRYTMLNQTPEDIPNLVPGAHDAEAERVATQALASERKMLAMQSSYRWKHGVADLLMQCACLRVTRIDPAAKPCPLANGGVRCAVCGQEEHCNSYAIDLAGPTVPAFAFCTDAKQAVKAYHTFSGKYARAYAAFDAPGAMGPDVGRIYAGSDCFRKLVLSWLAAHTINTWIYNTHYELDRLIRSSQGLANDRYVCATPDAAKDFMVATAQLKEAVAGNHSVCLPVVEFDENFFVRLDRQRETAFKASSSSGTGPREFATKLHARLVDAIAHVAEGGAGSLGNFLLEEDGSEEGDESEESDESEEGDESKEGDESEESDQSYQSNDSVHVTIRRRSSLDEGDGSGDLAKVHRKRHRIVDDTDECDAPSQHEVSINEGCRLCDLGVRATEVHRDLARLALASIDVPVELLADHCSRAMPLMIEFRRCVASAVNDGQVGREILSARGDLVSKLRGSVDCIADVYSAAVRHGDVDLYTTIHHVVQHMHKLLLDTENAINRDLLLQV